MMNDPEKTSWNSKANWVQMDAWSTSCEFQEVKELWPDVTAETLDECIGAFVRGEGVQSEEEARKSERLLEMLRNDVPDNPGANAGGPIYWAYRRCYKGAVAWLLLYTAFIYQGMFFGVSVFTFLPVLVNGALFNHFYRAKAFKELKRALSLGTRDKKEVLARMRRAGGVDKPAALRAGLSWTLLFALGVVLFALLFPNRFFR
jgi:hypothetical protein